MRPSPRAAAIVLLLCGCSGRPVEPISWAVDEDAFRDHVRTLSSAPFQGRRPATAGEDATVAYLSEIFKKLGLKPGNGSAFTQPVPLIEITPQGPAQLWFEGRGLRLDLENGREVVIWSKRAEEQTRLQDSEVVFAGHGVVAPEFNWDDYGALDVTGKTVILLGDAPPLSGPAAGATKGRAAGSYARWDYKLREAARRGAAAVLMIHDNSGADEAWSALKNRWSGPQFVADDGGHEAHAGIEGWISAESVRALFKAAGVPFDAALGAASQRGFKPLTLPLRAGGQLRNLIRHTHSSNVLAWLPGSERSREYVLYTAQWDHLGMNAAASEIFPGAIDNASGVAALLTLAQSISRMPQRPARSIVFLCTTAGQSSGLGAAWYVQHPLFALKNTAAVIEINRMHVGGPTRDVMVAGLGSSELESYLRGAALLQGRELREAPAGPMEFFRTDSFSFASAGVPTVLARAGLDDAARGPVWGKSQLDDYLQHRHLQPTDQYSADWDLRGTLQDLELYRALGLRLAREWRFPNWLPSSEFRAARELQRPEDAAGRPIP